MNKNNILKHIRFNKRKNIKSEFDSINNIFNLIKINNNYYQQQLFLYYCN